MVQRAIGVCVGYEYEFRVTSYIAWDIKGYHTSPGGTMVTNTEEAYQ